MTQGVAQEPQGLVSVPGEQELLVAVSSPSCSRKLPAVFAPAMGLRKGSSSCSCVKLRAGNLRNPGFTVAPQMAFCMGCWCWSNTQVFPWWPFVFSMLLVALGLLDTVSRVTAECLHVAPFSGGFPNFFFFFKSN